MLRLRWFGKPMRRRAGARFTGPPLTAAYWNGAAPAPRDVKEIDVTGAFIESAEPWRAGTLIHLVLQSRPAQKRMRREGQTFALWAKITQSSPGGMGVKFVFESPTERKKFREFLEALNGESEEMKPEKAARGENGQSLIECALVLPILLMLILNVVNFGALIYAWITVANAARAGAEYMTIGPAMVTAPSSPRLEDVDALVRRDLAALPNQDSVQIRVCSNNASRTPAIECFGTGTADPPQDPEPASFVLGTVEVNYTYRPVVPLAVPGETTIRQRAAMRFLQ